MLELARKLLQSDVLFDDMIPFAIFHLALLDMRTIDYSSAHHLSNLKV